MPWVGPEKEGRMVGDTGFVPAVRVAAPVPRRRMDASLCSEDRGTAWCGVARK